MSALAHRNAISLRQARRQSRMANRESRLARANNLPFVYQEARKLALKAHHALGCRGVTRADFRYDGRRMGTGGLFCLEV